MNSNIRFVSTRGDVPPCSFVDAMLKGLAADGGLYVPETIPRLPEPFWKSLAERTLRQVGREIATPYFETKSEKRLVGEVVDSTLTFDAPLVHLHGDIYLLELFHGPTLAFKDFGARFMARALARMAGEKKKGDLVILVATSGDTGSAVAHGFHGVKGTRICLLYPSGKVSPLQEKQMTTLGGNVTALEVDGTFDECQGLVKQAFSDRELGNVLRLSSANSINIARLLPQSFYYVWGLGRLQERLGNDVNPVFSVPSGNFGNLTAGLTGFKMGMPAYRFLAATNRNDVVPQYLQSGEFLPRPSVQTISNAMDVGNPSNFERVRYLFDGSHEQIRKRIRGESFSDRQTRGCIKKTYEQTGYIPDPHTAVGLLAAESYIRESRPGVPVIVLSTAHPAKFGDIVEQQIGRKVEMPERLKACLEKEKQSTPIGKEYEEFRKFLVERF